MSVLRRYANGILEIRLRVSSDGILKREMAFPPYAEQMQIVSFLNAKLSHVEQLITNVQTQIEKLKEYRTSLVVEAVTRGLCPCNMKSTEKIEWLSEIPAHWIECRIKNAIFPQEKEILPTDQIITCFRDGEVTLRSKRREDGFTVSFTEHGYHGVDIGDLVIHGMDAFAGAIGCSDSRGKTTPVVHVCNTVGKALVEMANKNGRAAFYIPTEGFDSTMYAIARHCMSENREFLGKVDDIKKYE